MHGIIFAEFRKFLEARHEVHIWSTLLQRAGLGAKLYLPTIDYADHELFSILHAASEFDHRDTNEILEQFGEFILPDLIRLHASLIDPKWRTLDLVLNTELAIHTVLRGTEHAARPPELKTIRTGSNEVTVLYSSPRRMSAFAKGIIRGAAKHYGESVKVTEESCMLSGGQGCKIKVTLSG